MVTGADASTVLVIGVGNELLGDEGFGVHVARALVTPGNRLPERVTVLEAGTALLDLAPNLARASWVIMVDAIAVGEPPGTLYRLDGHELLTQAPAGEPLSPHQWGVVETLQAMRAAGLVPESITVIGAEPESLEPGTELSPRLQAARDFVVAALCEELRE